MKHAILKTRFRLTGHTDRHGTEEYNDRLSRERARAVKEYVVREYGVERDRIVVSGRGESELLYEGEDERADRLNRRVELAVEE